MELSVSDFVAVVGMLVSAIAILYMRNMGIQIEHLRKDNEKLWKDIGLLRGMVQATRENYVNKGDFNGAVTRIFSKLDLIDGKFMRLLASPDCHGKIDKLSDMLDKRK